VVIRTDGSGFGAKWHLYSLTVTNLSTGLSDIFRHGDWVHTDPVTLTNSADMTAPVTVGYTIQTVTSNIKFAGTDAPVLLTVCGPDGKVLMGQPFSLENSANNFERGRTDVFTFEVPRAKDCGFPLSRVAIELGRAMIPDGWHLDRLDITCMEPPIKYTMACEAWLDRKHGTKKEWTLEGHQRGDSMDLRLVHVTGQDLKPHTTAASDQAQTLSDRQAQMPSGNQAAVLGSTGTPAATAGGSCMTNCN
jgi:hypothetical protein